MLKTERPVSVDIFAHVLFDQHGNTARQLRAFAACYLDAGIATRDREPRLAAACLDDARAAIVAAQRLDVVARLAAEVRGAVERARVAGLDAADVERALRLAVRP